MLHSTLPRAFLPPGLSYLGGYYGEDGHVYTSGAHYVPCHEDPYGMRIAEPRIPLNSWENARPVSPCPLDLSLKPAPTSSPVANVTRTIDERMEDGETIEVGDEDEEELRFALSPGSKTSSTSKRPYSRSLEVEEVRADIRATTSVHDYRSYLEMMPIKDSREASGPPPGVTRHEDILQSSKIRSYEALMTKRETDDPGYVVNRETTQEDNPDYSLRKPDSPVNSANYQQLLLTPQHHLQSIHAPMTPPSTPSPPQCPRRRHREEPEVTPSSTNGTTPRHQNVGEKSSRIKKKHARRLKFDEDTSSPVSGTVILGPDEAVVTGDIDPAFNIVEVTEEARAELAKIENRLGPYQCKLCRHLHEDAFQLAQHRCSRIAHVEYRCPECDKRFSCPANLASHRRWHKPRIPNPENVNGAANNSTRETEIACNRCDVKFTRAAALRKHLATQHPETNNNVVMTNHNSNNNNNNSNDNVLAFEDLNVSVTGKPPLCVPVSMNLSNVTLPNELP